MSKISVIIPIYKVEKFLRQCLDSVVNQTFRDLEIILVDDCSPDKCGEICDEYAARDERVKVIHKENGGMVSAMNCGLERVTGEWVTFVDADDWLDTDYYEHMFSTIKPETTPDIHFAQGYYEERAKGAAAEIHLYSVPFEAATTSQIVPLLVYTLVDHRNGGWLPANGYDWNKLYRREFLCANGLCFAEDIIKRGTWCDSLFNFQAICKAKKITGGSAVGYHYRQVNGSSVHRYNPYAVQTRVAYLHEINRLAQEYGMTAELQQAIYAKTVRGFGGCLLSIFHPNNKDSKQAAACPEKRKQHNKRSGPRYVSGGVLAARNAGQAGRGL